MTDRALEIVRGIWRDLTDRRGFSMDDLDDPTKSEIVGRWYVIASQGVNPGSDPPVIPEDILVRVRGW